MVALCDQAGTVRAGEELDLTRLQPFLLEHFGSSGPVSIEQFPSGHSNLTYLVRLGTSDWRPGTRPAPSAVWQQGSVRARHGARVSRAVEAARSLSRRAEGARSIATICRF